MASRIRPSSFTASFAAATAASTSKTETCLSCLSRHLMTLSSSMVGARISINTPSITACPVTKAAKNVRRGVMCSASSPSALPSALLFDCDGVLVDTEKDGHRISFNDTFAERDLGVTWGVELYGELLKIGGGKERMTAYFNKTGWPEKAPQSEEERKEFIASLHKRKTELFMALIEKKLLPLRPGVAKYAPV